MERYSVPFMKVTCAVCDSERVKRVRKKFAARYNQVLVFGIKARLPIRLVETHPGGIPPA